MDAAKENPATYVLHIASQTMVGQGIGIGSSLGIFDIMATLQTPETYGQIAELGKWKPRYIKEWLNLMVCGHIVEYNVEEETYYLPKAMRPVVSTYGKSQNLGVFHEFLNIFGIPIREVSACFAQNGPIGLPYSSYPGFHECQSRFRDVTASWENWKQIFQTIPGLCDKLEAGIEVCDGGCNTGNDVIMMAGHYPKSTFTGFDLSEESINTARAKCKQNNLGNTKFEVQDVCKMTSDWENSFDFFTVNDFVHDLPFPKLFLLEVMHVLKPGGIFLMVDVNVHTNVEDNVENHLATLMYGASLFHCMTLSLSTEGSEGLGTCWGVEKQRQYLVEAGFQNVSQLLDAPDAMESYFVGYKPE